MRAVIQRVKKSLVRVEQKIVGNISTGLLILLAVSPDDCQDDAIYLADKISNLRIFPDDANKMNLSLCDIKGEALVVSQFTLYGDCRKGRRPSFNKAAPPQQAEKLYDFFCSHLAQKVPVATGRFQAMMEIELINDGPVTLLVES